MADNANVTILNDDGSVEDCFVTAGGHPRILGNILNDYYQDEAKTRRLVDLGWVEHVGITTEASPLVKRFGGEWSDNHDLMAILGQKQVLAHLGGGVYDMRPNEKMVKGGLTAKQSKMGDQLLDVLEKMDSQYTLATYRDGIVDIEPEPHQAKLADLTSNDFEYIYDPKRAPGDKWIYNHVPAEEQYLSYGDFKAQGISWHSLSDTLKSKNK